MAGLSLAARNLLRNRRRSLATLLALAIGTASILLFGGYRANIEYSMHTAYVRDGGHLQIQHRDYFLYGSGNPIAYGIEGYQEIMTAVASDPVLRNMVVIVSPVLQFGGIASNHLADVSRTVQVVGRIGEAVNRMRTWNQFRLPLPPAPFALEGAADNAALVGAGVARVLRLCQPLGVDDCPHPVEEGAETGGVDLPTDIAALASDAAGGTPGSSPGSTRVDLLASGSGGAPNVVAMDVIEVERQGFKEVDEVYVLTQLPLAQRLVYGRGDPKVTSLQVQLNRSEQIEPARQRLEELLAARGADQRLVVRNFRELNPFFVQTVEMFGTIFSFIFALIAAIVLFTVGNTMSTAVMERTVEIGTVRAIGVRRRGIQRLFVLEGLMLGVAGAAFGALFALVASGTFNSLGLTWLPPGSGVRLPLQLVVWGEIGTITLTVVGLASVAALSAWWPARRASRLVIVDALRHA
ncbi:MAG: ABC transporter permease [Burkholderiales bacterium]|nr:ABC transporter permease [Burkholderiales bacterium]